MASLRSAASIDAGEGKSSEYRNRKRIPRPWMRPGKCDDDFKEDAASLDNKARQFP